MEGADLQEGPGAGPHAGHGVGYVSSTVAAGTDENWVIPPKGTLNTQQFLLFEEQEIGDSWFETGTPEVLLPRNVPVAGT